MIYKWWESENYNPDFCLNLQLFATSNSGGSTGNQSKQSIGKRLGTKKSGGEVVWSGVIIRRQRGREIKAGTGVKMGKDFTLYSITSGKVLYKKNGGKKTVYVL